MLKRRCSYSTKREKTDSSSLPSAFPRQPSWLSKTTIRPGMKTTRPLCPLLKIQMSELFGILDGEMGLNLLNSNPHHKATANPPARHICFMYSFTSKSTDFAWVCSQTVIYVWLWFYSWSPAKHLRLNGIIRHVGHAVIIWTGMHQVLSPRDV